MLTCLGRQKLGEAFFSLPDEISVQILCYLSQPDIFALRLTSRFVYSFLQAHASPISRSILTQCAYEHTSEENTAEDEKAKFTYNYIQTIYPQPQPCNSTDYLMQMLRRQSQVDRMLSVVTSFVQMKIYLIPSFPRFDVFYPYKMKLIRRLHLAAWTIYHFLEKYREMLVLEHPSHPQPDISQSDGPTEPGTRSCTSCVEFVKTLLPTYPGTEIIAAYHFYELSRQHLRSLSRPPTYSGSLERKLRGWSRKPPTDGDLMQLVVFGGIPELCKLSMLKGSANQRIEAIGCFVDWVYGASTQSRFRSQPSSSSALRDLAKGSTVSNPSFIDRSNPLQPPYPSISHSVVSAVPDMASFVVDSDEWITRMFELVRPEDQIVSAFGFVQNILAGKGTRRRDDGGHGVSHGGSESGLGDEAVDYLAPIWGFN